MNGWTGKALRVNLTTGEVTHEGIDPEILKTYLGGRGLGAYFLYREVLPGTEPLGPENLLVFCTGPLTGTTVPTGGRSSLTTLSPLTGTIFDANSGAAIGSRIKWAGYDAILIVGKSETPVWLEVTPEGGVLHPAETLWGQNIPETVSQLTAKDSAVVCVGPAGENQVLISAIMDEKGHAFGRGGVGAVMGSKNLKAIRATGTERPVSADPERLDFVQYEAKKWISASPRTSQGLPEFGTSVLVNLMNHYGVLPTRNFQEGCFDEAEAISGERLRDAHLVKRSACLGCPIGCKRQTKTGNELGEGPEYETIYALGSNLGISDFDALIEANYLCNELGLDTISVGATLSCAMELAERGLLETALRFGETTHLKEAITAMAERRGVGDRLSEGSRRLAERCGAPETAMQVKGLEFPGYDPRGMQGQGLLYATSNRGACHLRGNMLGPELLGAPKMLDRHATSGKAGVLIVMQHTSTVIDSIGLCKFVGFAIGDEFFARLLSAVTGEHYEVQDLLTAGERIWNLERLYNLRAGFTSADDTLPKRFLETPHTTGGSQGHVVDLAPMLKEYYRFRGWDAGGVPTPRKLKALGLAEIAQEVTHA
jgi:aldehyde:ferredoxin oxidoreductase